MTTSNIYHKFITDTALVAFLDKCNRRKRDNKLNGSIGRKRYLQYNKEDVIQN